LEGRKGRGIKLKPHVLSLPVSGDDELAKNGSFEVRARDGVDDFGIIGDDAFRYLLADAVFLNGPPRRLYLWKLRHCSLSLTLTNSPMRFPAFSPFSFSTCLTCNSQFVFLFWAAGLCGVAINGVRSSCHSMPTDASDSSHLDLDWNNSILDRTSISFNVWAGPVIK